MNTERLTELLGEVTEGRATATAEILPLVYDELRRVARGLMHGRRGPDTLQPTALVNEACAKLLGSAHLSVVNRAHFFAIAAMAMRQVLSSHAREKRAQKRSAPGVRVTLTGVTGQDNEVDSLALDDALTKLAKLDPRQSKLVELRFFAGMTSEEAAVVMELSEATINREWRSARAFLRNELLNGMSGGQGTDL